MKKLIALIVLSLALSAFALDLKSLRKQGAVGELPDGHVATVALNPSQEIKDFIVDINKKRDIEYKKIASKNKLELADVGGVAHKKILDKLHKGAFYKNAEGQWVTKE